MTSVVIGLDTSNYRTSVAAVTLEGEIVLNHRSLLPVPAGERGLRQSEAVFAHVRQLAAASSEIRRVAGAYPIAAVDASSQPRDGESSYMPVFQAGVTAGSILAAGLDVPFFTTTHQRGHLAAAAHGTPLAGTGEMLALHLSGGTTDLLWLRDGELKQIGGSLDLHAGQLVDRVGVALGMSFPAGPELEQLAIRGVSEGRLGVSMEQGDLFCHLSGAESQLQRELRRGEARPEDLAREVYDLLARTVARMLRAGKQVTGLDQALVAGGVAASPLFRMLLDQRLSKDRQAPSAVYGSPDLSGDNAVGVALIGIKEIKNVRDYS